MKLIEEPNNDAKLWTLSAIAKFIVGDGGSFRNLVYDYLGLDYDEADVTNYDLCYELFRDAKCNT